MSDNQELKFAKGNETNPVVEFLAKMTDGLLSVGMGATEWARKAADQKAKKNEARAKRKKMQDLYEKGFDAAKDDYEDKYDDSVSSGADDKEVSHNGDKMSLEDYLEDNSIFGTDYSNALWASAAENNYAYFQGSWDYNDGIEKVKKENPDMADIYLQAFKDAFDGYSPMSMSKVNRIKGETRLSKANKKKTEVEKKKAQEITLPLNIKGGKDGDGGAGKKDAGKNDGKDGAADGVTVKLVDPASIKKFPVSGELKDFSELRKEKPLSDGLENYDKVNSMLDKLYEGDYIDIDPKKFQAIRDMGIIHHGKDDQDPGQAMGQALMAGIGGGLGEGVGQAIEPANLAKTFGKAMVEGAASDFLTKKFYKGGKGGISSKMAQGRANAALGGAFAALDIFSTAIGGGYDGMSAGEIFSSIIGWDAFVTGMASGYDSFKAGKKMMGKMAGAESTGLQIGITLEGLAQALDGWSKVLGAIGGFIGQIANILSIIGLILLGVGFVLTLFLFTAPVGTALMTAGKTLFDVSNFLSKISDFINTASSILSTFSFILHFAAMPLVASDPTILAEVTLAIKEGVSSRTKSFVEGKVSAAGKHTGEHCTKDGRKKHFEAKQKKKQEREDLMAQAKGNNKVIKGFNYYKLKMKKKLKEYAGVEDASLGVEGRKDRDGNVRKSSKDTKLNLVKGVISHATGYQKMQDGFNDIRDAGEQVKIGYQSGKMERKQARDQNTPENRQKQKDAKKKYKDEKKDKQGDIDAKKDEQHDAKKKQVAAEEEKRKLDKQYKEQEEKKQKKKEQQQKKQEEYEATQKKLHEAEKIRKKKAEEYTKALDDMETKRQDLLKKQKEIQVLMDKSKKVFQDVNDPKEQAAQIRRLQTQIDATKGDMDAINDEYKRLHRDYKQATTDMLVTARDRYVIASNLQTIKREQRRLQDDIQTITTNQGKLDEKRYDLHWTIHEEARRQGQLTEQIDALQKSVDQARDEYDKLTGTQKLFDVDPSLITKKRHEIDPGDATINFYGPITKGLSTILDKAFKVDTSLEGMLDKLVDAKFGTALAKAPAPSKGTEDKKIFDDALAFVKGLGSTTDKVVEYAVQDIVALCNKPDYKALNSLQVSGIVTCQSPGQVAFAFSDAAPINPRMIAMHHGNLEQVVTYATKRIKETLPKQLATAKTDQERQKVRETLVKQVEGAAKAKALQQANVQKVTTAISKELDKGKDKYPTTSASKQVTQVNGQLQTISEVKKYFSTPDKKDGSLTTLPSAVHGVAGVVGGPMAAIASAAVDLTGTTIGRWIKQSIQESKDAALFGKLADIEKQQAKRETQDWIKSSYGKEFGPTTLSAEDKKDPAKVKANEASNKKKSQDKAAASASVDKLLDKKTTQMGGTPPDRSKDTSGRPSAVQDKNDPDKASDALNKLTKLRSVATEELIKYTDPNKFDSSFYQAGVKIDHTLLDLSQSYEKELDTSLDYNANVVDVAELLLGKKAVKDLKGEATQMKDNVATIKDQENAKQANLQQGIVANNKVASKAGTADNAWSSFLSGLTSGWIGKVMGAMTGDAGESIDGNQLKDGIKVPDNKDEKTGAKTQSQIDNATKDTKKRQEEQKKERANLEVARDNYETQLSSTDADMSARLSKKLTSMSEQKAGMMTETNKRSALTSNYFQQQKELNDVSVTALGDDATDYQKVVFILMEQDTLTKEIVDAKEKSS